MPAPVSGLKMTLRRLGEEQPIYGEGSGKITIILHVGGTFVHIPAASYEGGRSFIFDDVDFGDLSLLYLDELSHSCGINGFKKYYRKECDRFVPVQRDRALHKYCEEHAATNRIHLYVDPDMTIYFESQAGSSNIVRSNDNDDQDKNDVHVSYYSDEDPDYFIRDGDDSAYSSDGDPYDGMTYMTAGDDTLFDANVDMNEELVGIGENDAVNVHMEGNDGVRGNDSDSRDEADSEYDMDSLKGSDEEPNIGNNHVFNANRDMQDPHLYCGLEFANFDEFKEAVKNYNIKRGRSITFYKSDKQICRAKCKVPGCEWEIYARLMNHNKIVEVRGFEYEHKCNFNCRNSTVSSTWIAKKYLEEFKLDPDPKIQIFRKKVMKDNRCHVSPWQAYKAKAAALRTIQGHQHDQYGKLWDYIEELKRSDPEATVIMKVCDTENADVLIDPVTHETIVRPTNRSRFHRMYCCFSATKKGFIAGCRPIFGIDGCHLKSDYSGMLLTAVGLDPNNNLYPIAYALVEVEAKESWIWFLELLREDLKIENEHEWTVVSDKQKGLIGACETVIPGVQHRFCVRHMHANMALEGYKGKQLKDVFYEAAKATTVPRFDKAMEKIQTIDKNAAAWLKKKDPTSWTRAHFNTYPRCDMIVNNVCESWNAKILDARQMPIIQMFEWLRKYLMVRFQEKRDIARQKWNNMRICPKILQRVRKNMEEAASSIAYKAHDNEYECEQYDGRTCRVSLTNKICTCRKWELNGIPCPHACAALSIPPIKDPIDYVDECYSVDAYLKVYEYSIPPMAGIDDWGDSGRLGPLPPLERRQPGRPKLKRRKSAGESLILKGSTNTRKLSRVGLGGLCSVCKQPGHNKRSCKETRSEAKKVVPKRKGVNVPSQHGGYGRTKKTRPGTSRAGTLVHDGVISTSTLEKDGAKSVDVGNQTEKSQPVRTSPRGFSKVGDTSSMTINGSQHVRRSPQGFSKAGETSSMSINESLPVRRSPRGFYKSGHTSSMNINESRSVCTSSRVLFKSIANNEETTETTEHPISDGLGHTVKGRKILRKLSCKRSSAKIA